MAAMANIDASKTTDDKCHPDNKQGVIILHPNPSIQASSSLPSKILISIYIYISKNKRSTAHLFFLNIFFIKKILRTSPKVVPLGTTTTALGWIQTASQPSDALAAAAEDLVLR